MKTIVFVCTGNTCRSVMAEYLLRKYLSDSSVGENLCRAVSRGTAASDAFRVPDIVKKLLAAEGAAATDAHKSTQISAADINGAEAVYVMESHHKALLEAQFGRTSKIKLLAGNREIPDPIGSPEDVYRETFGVIKNLVSELARAIAADIK